MKESLFINLVSEMYDRSMEIIRTEDEDKIMGRLLNLAKVAKEEDPNGLLEMSIFAKVLNEYAKDGEWEQHDSQ